MQLSRTRTLAPPLILGPLLLRRLLPLGVDVVPKGLQASAPEPLLAVFLALLLLLVLMATVSNLALKTMKNLASGASPRASKVSLRTPRRLLALQRCLTLNATLSCRALLTSRRKLTRTIQSSASTRTRQMPNLSSSHWNKVTLDQRQTPTARLAERPAAGYYCFW